MAQGMGVYRMGDRQDLFHGLGTVAVLDTTRVDSKQKEKFMTQWIEVNTPWYNRDPGPAVIELEKHFRAWTETRAAMCRQEFGESQDEAWEKFLDKMEHIHGRSAQESMDLLNECLRENSDFQVGNVQAYDDEWLQSIRDGYGYNWRVVAAEWLNKITKMNAWSAQLIPPTKLAELSERVDTEQEARSFCDHSACRPGVVVEIVSRETGITRQYLIGSGGLNPHDVGFQENDIVVRYAVLDLDEYSIEE